MSADEDYITIPNSVEGIASWVITIKHDDGIFYPHAVGVTCPIEGCPLLKERCKQ